MKAVISITVDLFDGQTRAGLSLYDEEGELLASESSSGRNVAKRSAEQVLRQLLRQAEALAADADPCGVEPERF